MPVAQARPLPTSAQAPAVPVAQAVVVQDSQPRETQGLPLAPGSSLPLAPGAQNWQPQNMEFGVQSLMRAPPSEVPGRGTVVIALDVDEVLVEYVEGFRKFLVQANPDGPLDAVSVFHEAHSATSSYRLDFCTNGGLDNLEEVPGASDALRRLKAVGVQLEALTSRNPSMRESTETLILQVFGPDLFTAAHFTAGTSKGAYCERIGAVAIVDDQILNVIDTSSYGVISVLFDFNGGYPWCRCNPEDLPPSVRKCESWSETCDYLFHALQLPQEPADAGRSYPGPSTSAPSVQQQQQQYQQQQRQQLQPPFDQVLQYQQHQLEQQQQPPATMQPSVPAASAIAAKALEGREVWVAPSAGELRAKEARGTDEVGIGDWLDYAKALAICFSKGHDNVMAETYGFLEMQGRALQPETSVRSSFPSFDVRSRNGAPSDIERIVIDVAIRRREDVYLVAYKYRSAQLEAGASLFASPPVSVFQPASGSRPRGRSTTPPPTEHKPTWRPNDSPPVPVVSPSMPAPPPAGDSPTPPLVNPQINPQQRNARPSLVARPGESAQLPPGPQKLDPATPSAVPAVPPSEYQKSQMYRIGMLDPARQPRLYPNEEEDAALCVIN